MNTPKNSKPRNVELWKTIIGDKKVEELIPHWMGNVWTMLWHLLAGYVMHKGWNYTMAPLLGGAGYELSLFEATFIWICLYY
jgi:hypothetical protein